MENALFIYALGCLGAASLMTINLLAKFLIVILFGERIYNQNLAKIGLHYYYLTGEYTPNVRTLGNLIWIFFISVIASWFTVLTELWHSTSLLLNLTRKFLNRVPEKQIELLYPVRNNPSLEPEAVWARAYALSLLVTGNKPSAASVAAELDVVYERTNNFDREKSVRHLASILGVSETLFSSCKYNKATDFDFSDKDSRYSFTVDTQSSSFKVSYGPEDYSCEGKDVYDYRLVDNSFEARLKSKVWRFDYGSDQVSLEVQNYIVNEEGLRKQNSENKVFGKTEQEMNEEIASLNMKVIWHKVDFSFNFLLSIANRDVIDCDKFNAEVSHFKRTLENSIKLFKEKASSFGLEAIETEWESLTVRLEQEGEVDTVALNKAFESLISLVLEVCPLRREDLLSAPRKLKFIASAFRQADEAA